MHVRYAPESTETDRFGIGSAASARATPNPKRDAMDFQKFLEVHVQIESFLDVCVRVFVGCAMFAGQRQR